MCNAARSLIGRQLNVVIAAAILLYSGTVLCAGKQMPAFPTAEGFGAISTGGRGGRVIKVTNLNSSGPGSLKEAASAEGPRIVIFDVAGVIRGDIEIKHSNITIAGQTAPSPGITIEGRLFAHAENGDRLHDIVVRFLRFRPPPTTGANGDSVQLPNTERVILDHLSLSWANDELIDIIYSSEVTIQWCTIEESDPTGHEKGVPHNYGVLSAYPGSGNVSIHHNLFANSSRRLPSLSPGDEGKPGDFRNNLIYNFYEGLGHDGHKPKSGINMVSNYYKRGPSAVRIYPFHLSEKGKYYFSGNYIEDLGFIDSPDDFSLWDRIWVKVDKKGIMLKNPVPVAPITTTSAQKAYTQVLAAAGAFPRDRVTRRTIKEVLDGGGNWRRNAPDKPNDNWFLSGLLKEKSLMDTDGDGIPDNWEETMGLDKYDKSDSSKLMHTGYTAIEEFINYRAMFVIKK